AWCAPSSRSDAPRGGGRGGAAGASRWPTWCIAGPKRVGLRVAVIGAGVLGASIAGNLARLGHTVTLIEARGVGAGTTATSFAWINANQKTPRDYFELNAAGLAAHRRAAAEGKAAPWLHLTGHLQWAVGDAGQSGLHAKDERLRAWGYAVRRLRRSEVRDLEPDLLLDRVDELSYYPDEGYVQPMLYLDHLVRLGEELGIRLRTGSAVVDFEGAGGRLHAVRMASGDVATADVFVSCCGRWTPEVAARAGASIAPVPVGGLPGRWPAGRPGARRAQARAGGPLAAAQHAAGWGRPNPAAGSRPGGDGRAGGATPHRFAAGRRAAAAGGAAAEALRW